MFCFVCFVLVDPFCAARARRNSFAVQRDGEREAAAANSEAAREGSAMAAVEALLCSSPVATEVDPTFVARSEATDCRSERCCADVHVGAHEAVAARSKAARDGGAMATVEALLLRSPPGRPWRPSSGSAVDPRLSPPPMSSLSHFREYAADHAVAAAALGGGGDLVDTPGRYGDAAAARDDEGDATPVALLCSSSAGSARVTAAGTGGSAPRARPTGSPASVPRQKEYNAYFIFWLSNRDELHAKASALPGSASTHVSQLAKVHIVV